MKKINMLLALLLICVNLQAQSKLWLSGYHSNASLRYLYDGVYAVIPVVWEGGTPTNNVNVVVFGQYKKDNDGTIYFAVEKSEKKVTLFSGNYVNAKYNCPLKYQEGKLTTSTNSAVTYASFVPLDAQGYIEVRNAEWGIKVCNGSTHNVYYIREVGFGDNAAQYVQEQNAFSTSGGNAGKSEKNTMENYSGKIISIENNDPLIVKHYAVLETGNGNQIIISSLRPMKIGERVNLVGAFKTVYWDGVMKTSWVFFVEEIN